MAEFTKRHLKLLQDCLSDSIEELKQEIEGFERVRSMNSEKRKLKALQDLRSIIRQTLEKM